MDAFACLPCGEPGCRAAMVRAGRGIGVLLCLLRTVSVFSPVLWDLGGASPPGCWSHIIQAFHGAAAKAGLPGECRSFFLENPGKLVLLLECVEGQGERCLPPPFLVS